VKSFYRYQFPLLIWGVIIFILSSIETVPHFETPIITEDKLAHISIYFVFCWLSHRALFFQTKFPLLKWHSLVGAFLLTCLYGYLDEVHQLFVPGRTYDYYDMLANAIGAFLFIICFVLINTWKRHRGNTG
jgi:VanZ family protein